jgi:hypothetical protein
MTRPAKIAVALVIVIGVALASGFMFGVTTFLFNFSGGQYRMGPVVGYGALAAMTATLLVAAIAWKIRSPAAAVLSTGVALAVNWTVAIFVEWRISYVLGSE